MKNLFVCSILVAVVAVLSTDAMSLSDIESELEAFQVQVRRRNIIDKVSYIQDMLDTFVASVVNGTPLPDELKALGADTDPQNFVMKVILMAASNLSKKRDLLSVSKVI